ncbi:MAG: ribonuclease R [Pirellulales bacterium]
MNDELSRRVLEYLLRPSYQPVKPRVIARKLELDDDGKRALRMVIKRLIKQGLIAYGAQHLVHVLSPTRGAAPAKHAPAVDGSPAEEPAPPAAQGRRKRKRAASPETADPVPDDATAPPAEVAREANTEEDAAVDEMTRDQEARAAERAARRAARRAADSEPRAIVTGTFRRAAAGFGFVRPRNSPTRDRSEDVYIPAEATRDAASGDLVTVRIGRRRFRRGGRERISGEIVEVLERQTQRFVGVYQETPDGGYVQVDGNLFTQPIAVGDPGAKLVAEGDKVVIEMVRFPTHFADGEAVLVEVLGARGQPGIDTLSIIHEFGLPDEFPEEVLAAAREQAEQFDPDDLRGRRDLTADVVVTIDPQDARDFDDAISLLRQENGHWLLGVHIADVAHFVPSRSPLDREARERGTSVYLPDRVLPMLPEVISNNLASLQPHKVRFARSALIEFTAEGVPVHAEVHASAIKSRQRFTYEEVDEYLADPAGWRSRLTPDVHALLGRMHELAMLLRHRRLERGAIELTLPEIKLDLDSAGRVTGAHVVEHTVSHQIIEEFMLAANEAVATLLHDRGIDCLRRVHESPDHRKLRELTTFVRELGIECESLESRFEIKRVIAAVAGRPESTAVNYAVLRSMQKAHYSPAETGHYALHSQHYAHFTSPIRRYPDLTVHRLFDALARGQRPHHTIESLAMLGEHCSEREQRAERAERELVKVKLLTHLAERIGERMQAVITGVEPFGLFAQGVKLPAEGLIHIDSLRDDVYHYEASSHSLTGRRAGEQYRLGDVIEVEISRVDPDRRALDFRLVKRGTSRRAPPQRESRGRPKSQGGEERRRTRGRRRR